MGYEWDDKRAICHRLYVEERKSLDEVLEYFRQRLDFVPSKRTFQTQFKRWGFPTKMDYSHKDEAVVNRVREMWEKNVMQKDMLPILLAEGYNVTESGLMRLRSKHGLHLKATNAARGIGTAEATVAATAPATPPEHDSSANPGAGAKRKDHEALLASSEQKYRQKKRRRHTKEWNGLPADPPGPPRYPSETTIGEAQVYLNLSDEMYREIREQFKAICEERGIIKKTICGPERWEEAKNFMIQSHPHLQQVFMNSGPSTLQPLQLSLDIICMDVTKHMRNQSKTMSLAEAKNTLGLNPLESRLLRDKFIQILIDNDFVNTYETENWNDLKDQWLEGTDIMDRVPPFGDPARERYLKALQLVCRDTLKRWRESHRSKARKANALKQTDSERDEMQAFSAKTKAKAAPRSATRKNQKASKTASAAILANNVQIDPSLLQAANSSSMRQDHSGHQPVVSQAYPIPDAAEATLEPPLAAYFRRGPLCTADGVPPIWLGAVTSRTRNGVCQAALSFPGGSRFGVAKVEGLVSTSNGELLYQIDQDDELHGYLLHNDGGKAMFIVHLTELS